MLVTPFDKTPAYRLGIVDEKGKILRKMAELRTDEERNAYTYLHRLVFNLKRILIKLPGGDSKLKNIVAAFFLIKECYEKNDSTAMLEEKYMVILEKLEQKNITLVEEELFVEEFMFLNEDAVANVTGAGVSTDIPVVKMKTGRRYAAFVVNDDIFKRFKKGKKKFSQWKEYLNLEDEGEQLIYKYATKNPKGILILKNGKDQKAIRFNRNGGGKWHKVQRSKKPSTEMQIEDV
jgi:hypothetical protein